MVILPKHIPILVETRIKTFCYLAETIHALICMLILNYIYIHDTPLVCTIYIIFGRYIILY